MLESSTKSYQKSIGRVDILVCNHKEADTRLSLHVKHATKYRNRELVWFLTTNAAVLGVSNSDQTRTRYVDISSNWRVRFCCTTKTRRINWLLYSQCFAGNPALKILKYKGEYQTAFSRLCRDMENLPDIGDALKIHLQTLWLGEDE